MNCSVRIYIDCIVPEELFPMLEPQNLRILFCSDLQAPKLGKGRSGSRPTLSQLRSLQILRSTLLSFIKFADLLIARLQNCETAGRVIRSFLYWTLGGMLNSLWDKGDGPLALMG